MYRPNNIEDLTPQDCLELSNIFWEMKHYKEAVKYLEAALVKEDSAIGHFLLATAYHFLPEELTEEEKEGIEKIREPLDSKSFFEGYLPNWENQQKGIYHLSKYRDLGGVPEIDEKKYDIVLGLLFASKNRKIVEIPLNYIVFGSKKDMRSRFSIEE